ncbi:MAG: DNA-directed RNA polymerase subunit omega, partial [Lachnospiraceae bacterium]|nr:DNA-directed RNA polymerase subunit omega [Lachnospiraceae bacterium]
ARRAKQIIAGSPALVLEKQGRFSKKPLSMAVEELEKGRVRILSEDAVSEDIQAEV